MKGYANPQLLVTPGELAERLRPGGPAPPLLIDLRPPDAYAAGHIPTAIHLDLWAVSLIDTDPAPLAAFTWMIEHVLAAHGIQTATPIVVYDEQSGMRAARAFWFLEYFGHPSVRMLDGGYNAWVAGRHEVTRESPAATKTDWTGRRDDRILATWRQVRAALDRPEAVLIDTRTVEEYSGTTVRASRGGAVPGAVHIEWTRNLTSAGDFKPASELKQMYEDAGVTPDKEVIAYCQGGYRAAHTYIALRLLGYPRVRMYLGSWQEWAERKELPVEIPKRN